MATDQRFHLVELVPSGSASQLQLKVERPNPRRAASSKKVGSLRSVVPGCTQPAASCGLAAARGRRGPALAARSGSRGGLRMLGVHACASRLSGGVRAAARKRLNASCWRDLFCREFSRRFVHTEQVFS